MLDYLYNAGFTKTFNEFRSEAPELVRITGRAIIDKLFSLFLTDLLMQG